MIGQWGIVAERQTAFWPTSSNPTRTDSRGVAKIWFQIKKDIWAVQFHIFVPWQGSDSVLRIRSYNDLRLSTGWALKIEQNWKWAGSRSASISVGPRSINIYILMQSSCSPHGVERWLEQSYYKTLQQVCSTWLQAQIHSSKSNWDSSFIKIRFKLLPSKSRTWHDYRCPLTRSDYGITAMLSKRPSNKIL